MFYPNARNLVMKSWFMLQKSSNLNTPHSSDIPGNTHLSPRGLDAVPWICFFWPPYFHCALAPAGVLARPRGFFAVDARGPWALETSLMLFPYSLIPEAMLDVEEMMLSRTKRVSVCVFLHDSRNQSGTSLPAADATASRCHAVAKAVDDAAGDRADAGNAVLDAARDPIVLLLWRHGGSVGRKRRGACVAYRAFLRGGFGVRFAAALLLSGFGRKG